MVHGVDLWLNNPVPPMEASGMKASLNGLPQLSILEGWWIEGFNGRNGWAFSGKGDNKEDSGFINDILEKEVIPLYYEIEDDGLPQSWVKIMKKAMKGTGQRFCSRRMIREYAIEFYQYALKSASM